MSRGIFEAQEDYHLFDQHPDKHPLVASVDKRTSYMRVSK